MLWEKFEDYLIDKNIAMSAGKMNSGTLNGEKNAGKIRALEKTGRRKRNRRKLESSIDCMIRED